MHKAVSAIIWVLIAGAFKWAFDSFLWDWFTRYLEEKWQIKEAVVVASVSSYVLPMLIVLGSYWVLFQIAKHRAAEALAKSPTPDLPIADAIDYIVNDSTAKLKQPASPLIADSGPAKGYPMIQKGVEHSDARTKLNERLISGELKIWGLKQMPVTHMANQFELSLREIEPTYWDRMQLDFLSCFYQTRTTPQTAQIPGKQADLQWTGLMVSQEQIRRAWPRKSILNRCIDKIKRKPRISYR